MPRIPTIDAPAAPAVTNIDPSSFSQVSRAQAGAFGQAADTFSRIADVAYQVNEREKEAERNMKYLEIDRDFRTDISNFSESLSNRRDYENFARDTQQFLQSTRERYLSQAGGDRLLQTAFERQYTTQALTLLDVAKTKRREIMTDRAKAAFTNQYDETLKNYSEETDPDRREIIRNDLEIAIGAMESSLFFSETEGEQIRQKFENEAESVRADKLIEVNPELALQALKGGDFDELRPDVKQAKVEKAQNEIEARKNREYREEQREDQRLRAARKKIQENTAVEYTFQLAEHGDINEAELREDLRIGKISRADFNSIMTDIRQQRQQSDPDELLEVRDGIAQGQIGRTDVLNNPLLSAEDKASLLDRVTTFEDDEFTERYSLGAEQLKSHIITTSPYMPPAEGEAERFADAKQELFFRLKAGEDFNTVLKEMIPRYDLRPEKLRSLQSPRFTIRPSNIQEVKTAKEEFLLKLTSGVIDMSTAEGQRAAQMEMDLLQAYENIFKRLETDGR